MNKNIRRFIENNRKAVIIAAMCLVVAIIIIVTSVIKNNGSKKEKEKTTTGVEETTEPTTEGTTEAKGDMKGKIYSLLTGEPINENKGNRRPIAVMYNNIIDAIPHSGISSADIVYEATVEGGLTRLMAIFENYDKVERLGSVRSCRLYYAHWATEYDAIYCHFGQSSYALDFLNSDSVDNLNGMEWVGGTVYFRSADRYAPHNAFTSPDKIKEGIKLKEYRESYDDSYKGHLKFVEYGTEQKLKKGKSAENIQLSYAINRPWFNYNKKTKLYERYQYGEKHIDDLTNKQVSCKNIIIQYCGFQVLGDGKTLNMNHIGEGTGSYITNGKAIEITWKKDTATSQTKYYNESGEEITLNTGKTWICIVPTGDEANVIMK